MSLIENLVKEKPAKKSGSEQDESTKLRPFVKTATDLQRLKLEKLMKNPSKPVVIPEQRREKDYMASVPTFVRNVMGSSAGAGSGEFHVYRHLRRKEYARQKNIQAQSAREEANESFQKKIDDNKRAAEDRTAKKRAKRLKKKQRAKRPRETKAAVAPEDANGTSDDSASDEDPSEVAEPSEKTQCDEAPESSEISKAATQIPDEDTASQDPPETPTDTNDVPISES